MGLRVRNFTRIGLTVVLAGALFTIAFGYLGRIHGIGDSLSVFRVPLALMSAATALAVLALGARRVGLAGLALACGALVSVYLQFGNNLPVSEDIVVYKKNRWVALRDPGPLAQDIIASQADFVTLQEVAGPIRPASSGARPHLSGATPLPLRQGWRHSGAVAHARGFGKLRLRGGQRPRLGGFRNHPRPGASRISAPALAVAVSAAIAGQGDGVRDVHLG